MIVVVTGSVGTGKTTLARKLAKELKFDYIDVNKIIKKYDISEGYDRKRKTKIIDINKLNKVLIKEIGDYKKAIKNIFNKEASTIKINNRKKAIINKSNKKIINKLKIRNGMIIDSHLSHYLPKKYVDLCIVTKCGLKVLEKRLKKRKYSKEKIRENLDAEIFDVCLNEAKENGHNVLVMDITKGIKNSLNSISKNENKSRG